MLPEPRWQPTRPMRICRSASTVANTWHSPQLPDDWITHHDHSLFRSHGDDRAGCWRDVVECRTADNRNADGRHGDEYRCRGCLGAAWWIVRHGKSVHVARG